MPKRSTNLDPQSFRRELVAFVEAETERSKERRAIAEEIFSVSSGVDKIVDDIISALSPLPDDYVAPTLPEEEPRLRKRSVAQLARQFPNQSKTLRCNQCWNVMVLKEGPSGIFYGCSKWTPQSRCRSSYHADQTTGEPILGVKAKVSTGFKTHRPACRPKPEVKTRFQLILEADD